MRGRLDPREVQFLELFHVSEHLPQLIFKLGHLLGIQVHASQMRHVIHVHGAFIF